MARTEKISVTVDSRVLAEVRKRIRKEKKSLSAFVSEALADQLRGLALDAALKGFEKEHGVLTAEELAKADATLKKAWSKQRRGRRAA